MAWHAYHHLALFDGFDGHPLWLGRAKGIASPDQRIMLHALDRGCTRPGCDAPGYRSDVPPHRRLGRRRAHRHRPAHLRLPPDHQLLDQGWTTRKNPDGTTAWILPPQLPLTGGTNDYHHPERLLPEDDG